jgi:hypothetical protein
MYEMYQLFCAGVGWTIVYPYLLHLFDGLLDFQVDRLLDKDFVLL